MSSEPQLRALATLQACRRELENQADTLELADSDMLPVVDAAALMMTDVINKMIECSNLVFEARKQNV